VGRKLQLHGLLGHESRIYFSGIAVKPMIHAKPGAANSPGEIWRADFLIETSALGCAADDLHFYGRLARQLHKMTTKPEYGRA
jgi:hypothetical protein